MAATSTSRERSVQRVARPAANTLCAVLALAVACGRESSVPTRAASAPAETAKAHTANAPAASPVKGSRLPEDPIAGERSEQQWREHKAKEEIERQLAFDYDRLPQHRAVVRLIGNARKRYDRARTEAAVARVKSTIAARTAEVRRRAKAIDPWGVTSPLLPDYEALATSLESGYVDARIAAIEGDAQALEAARADFDARLEKIADWLAKVEREKGGEFGRGRAGEFEREHAERH